MCRIPFGGSCLLPCEWTPTGGRGACWGLGHWFNRSIPGNSDRGGFSILLSCVLFKAVCDITHWETLHSFLPVKFSEKKNHAFSETRGFLFFFSKVIIIINVLEQNNVTSETGGHSLWFYKYFQLFDGFTVDRIVLIS